MAQYLAQRYINPEPVPKTAHASSAGVAVVSYHRDSPTNAELIAFRAYDSDDVHMVMPEEFYSCIMPDEDEQPELDYNSFYEAGRENGLMSAFGQSVSVGELIEANISFDIRGDESGFMLEKIEAPRADGTMFSLVARSELRGTQIHDQPSIYSFLAPLTTGEALLFIRLTRGPDLFEGTDIEFPVDVKCDEDGNVIKTTILEPVIPFKDRANIKSWVMGELEVAVEKVANAEEACREHNDAETRWRQDKDTKRLWRKQDPHLLDIFTMIKQVDYSFFKRAEATVERRNLDSVWSER